MENCIVWFNLMDWIESGGEAKIQIAVRDYIPFPNSFFPNSINIPPQILIPPLPRIKKSS